MSDRERARRQYDSQPWVVKYWKPILGSALGGFLSYKHSANFGPKHQKWRYPAVAAGMGLGALAGPGAVMGSYGFGRLAYHFWPGKLPVVGAASLVGGILGDLVFEWLFPDSPDPALLQDPEPGVFLPAQEFFLETSCIETMRTSHSESAYKVSYMYRGELREALVRRYPGASLELDGAGRPLQEIP